MNIYKDRLLSIDVHYRENSAKAVGIIFSLEDESQYEVIPAFGASMQPRE